MAKKISTKKKEPTLDPFGESGHEDSDKDDSKDKPDYAQQIANLSEKLAALEAVNDAQQDTISALMAQPQGGGYQQAQRTTTKAVNAGVSLDGLPDPLDDKDAYHKALQERIDSAITSAVQTSQSQASQQQSQEAKFEGLWDEFEDAYPDYAGSRKQVEFAATEVVSRAVKKGLDADRYMFTTSDKFFKDLTKEMDSVFGKPKTEDDDDADNDGDDDEGDDNSRSASIFGGLESGGSPGGHKPDPEAGDMLSEFAELQKKSGFF